MHTYNAPVVPPLLFSPLDAALSCWHAGSVVLGPAIAGRTAGAGPQSDLPAEAHAGRSSPVFARHDMVAAELVRALQRLHRREVGVVGRVHLQGRPSRHRQDLRRCHREGEDVGAVGWVVTIVSG